MYPVTTILSSLSALTFTFLAVRVIKLRRLHKVSVGMQNITELEMAVRAHGNFSEYVPIGLVLFLCAEANAVSIWVTSGIAVLFFAGRLFHAYAFLQTKQHFSWRVRGMVLTFFSLIVLAMINITYLILNANY